MLLPSLSARKTYSFIFLLLEFESASSGKVSLPLKTFTAEHIYNDVFSYS